MPYDLLPDWRSTYWGVDVDPVAARTGVITSVDAGSAGASDWRGFRRFHIQTVRSRLMAYLDIATPQSKFLNGGVPR